MFRKKFLVAVAMVASLAVGANAYTQHTGLDKVVKIIHTDKGLKYSTSAKDRHIAARSAKRMNNIIVSAIKRTGVARDGHISARDVKRLNHFIVAKHGKRWQRLHGDDKRIKLKGKKVKVEYGYHLVQKNGAKRKLYGKNAINNVFDSIYHIGFKTKHKRKLMNEDGKRNKNFKKIAHYLNKVLAKDLRRGRLA